ncbi:hypothetical protein ACFL43_03905 [Thermodesulfobacteriota bacterium]
MYDYKWYVNETIISSGSYLNMEEKYFDNGSVYLDMKELSDGRLAIVYRDDDDSNMGKITICNPTAESCVENIFNNVTTSYTKLEELSDGNIAIVYRDDDNYYYGTVAICNSSGESCTENLFSTNRSGGLDIVQLNNGDIAITYIDTNHSTYPKMAICNISGESCRRYTLNMSDAADMDIAKTSIGNVIVAFKDVGNSDYGTFAICNSTGESCTIKVFKSSVSRFNSLKVLSNDSLIVTYRDDDNSDYLTYSICNSSGDSCNSFVFGSRFNAYQTGITELSDSRVAISNYNTGDSSAGTITICNLSDNICENITYNEEVSYSSIISNEEDEIYVAFRDEANDTNGHITYYNPFAINYDYNLSELSKDYFTSNDEIVFSCLISDINSSTSWINSSTVNISQLLINDSLSSSSGQDDTPFTIYVEAIGLYNVSQVNVTVIDPNSYEFNYPMSTTDNDTTKTYSKTYIPSVDGVYSFIFSYKDIYGNKDYLISSLTYTESTYSAPTGGGGGGSGGTSVTVNVNHADNQTIEELIAGQLSSNVFLSLMTPGHTRGIFFIPTDDFLKDVTIRSENGDVNASLKFSDNLAPYFKGGICELRTNQCYDYITIKEDEEKYMRIYGNLSAERFVADFMENDKVEGYVMLYNGKNLNPFIYNISFVKYPSAKIFNETYKFTVKFNSKYAGDNFSITHQTTVYLLYILLAAIILGLAAWVVTLI